MTDPRRPPRTGLRWTGVRVAGPANPDDDHPEWCAGGHHCGLGEHRSEPYTVDVPGAGRVVAVRVRDRAGREWAEVRVKLQLNGPEPEARRQLYGLLDGFARLLRRFGRPT